MKALLSLFLMLLTNVWTARAQGETASVVWCADNTTLYFTYRPDLPSAGGTFTPADGGSTQTVTTVWSGTAVTSSPNTPGWYNTVRNSVTTVVFEPSFSQVRPTTMRAWFYAMTKLTSINGLENLNTSSVTSMYQTFYNCQGLTSLDLSGFDTSLVTDMSGMFQGCSNLESVNLSGWTNTKVTNMSSMFNGCSKLSSVGLTGFNTAAVTNMSYMFVNCKALQTLDLSSFDTSSLTNASYMFQNCILLESADLSGWTNPKLTNLGYLFSGCSKLSSVDFTDFNTAAVQNMTYMFYGCSAMTTNNLSSFDTSSLTTTANMFQNCSMLESVNLSGWINPKLTSMSSMFYGCSKLSSVDFTDFNTAAVQNMSYMFYGCSALSALNLSSFDTSSLTTTANMFQNCTLLGSVNLSGWANPRLTNMSNMFNGCSMLSSLNLTNFNTSAVTNMSRLFNACSSLQSVDLTGFNTAAVTDFSYMFYGCSGLQTLNLSSFNTVKATNMSCMFQNCSALTSLDISGFNTTLVTNMGSMFQNCSSLTLLDLSSFNTAKVTNMSSMFYGCSLLASIYVSDAWTAAAASSSSNMFNGCNSLMGEDETTLASYSPQSLDRTHATDEAGGYLKTGTSTELPEPMPYAVWVADNSTLYFLQTKRQLVAGRSFQPEGSSTPLKMTAVWNGTSVTASGSNNPQWYNTVRSLVTNVVFESSFADVSPNSTRCWFRDCSLLENISGIGNLNTDAVTNMGYMFSGCTTLPSLNLAGLNTGAVTNMEYLFSGCAALQNLTLTGMSTATVTTMQYMFNGCSSLSSLDLSGFNTEKVQNMAYMLQNCSSLSSANLSSFNTERTQSMAYMFSGCSNLTELQLSSFNTSNVSNTAYMFNGCTRLNAVYVSTTWTLSRVTSANNYKEMFTGCEAIIGQDGTTYDAAAVDKTKANYAVGGYLRHGTDAEGDLTTYALWCEGNATLYFLQSTKKLLAGSTFFPEGSENGQVVTNLWTANAVTNYSWNNTVRTKMTRAVYETSFADVSVTITRYWFNNCTLLTTVEGLDNLNTSALTNMEYMFQNCSSLQNIDLSSFNTEKVTSMQYLFYGCQALQNVNMGGMNTAAVTNMQYMFSGCSSLQNINLAGMNTASVTNMAYMFNGCASLTSIDLSSFNTNRVSNMNSMFNGCGNLVEAYISSAWSTANVSAGNSTNMFKDCINIVGQGGAIYDPSLTDKTLADDGDDGYMRSGTDTEIEPTPYVIYSETDNTLYFLVDNKVRNKGRSFLPPGNTNTVKITAVYTGNQITNYKTNYYSTPGWYREYANYITRVVIDESFSTVKPLMLRNYLSLKNMESIIGLQYLNTSEATTMAYMFEGCAKLTGTLDLSSFDTGKVENLNFIFDGCSLLQTINVTGVVTSTANSCTSMFRNCTALENIIGLESFDTSNLTSLSGLFANCSSLLALDLSGFNVSNVSNINGIFSGCTALKSISIKDWNIAKLTSLSSLFKGLIALESVDMSGVDISSVTNLETMFSGCTSLVDLDVTGWNTSSVTNMYGLFNECTALESIMGLNSLVGVNVASSAYMFANCSSLKEIDLSGFGQAYQMTTQDFKTMFQGCTALETLNLANFGVSSVTDFESLFAGLTNLKTLNATGWNTRNVTTMKSMFKGCESLENVIGFNQFNFSRVADMTELFYGCKSLENVPLPSTTLYVRGNLSYMFYGCESLTNIDLTNVISGSSSYRLSMDSMFEGCSVLESVSGISFYSVISAKNLFKGCSSLTTLNLPDDPRMEMLTDMTGMFEGCSSLTSLDFSKGDTRRLEQFSNMFKDCSSLERIYIGPSWMYYANTISGDNFDSGDDVFLGCTSIIGSDGTTYDASAVDWHKMHADVGGYLTAKAFPIAVYSESTQALYFLKTTNWTSGNYHLTGSVEPLEATNVITGEDVTNNFRHFRLNNVGDLITKVVFDQSFAEVRPASCYGWFEDCANLTTLIGLENLNTSEVQSMGAMFRNCTSLTSLDLTTFDTRYVTNMMGMFEGCSQLQDLNISSFVTDSVSVMEAMFKNCSALQTIDVSRFNTSKVAVFNEMFAGCSALQHLELTGFDTSASDDMMGMFSGCTSLTSLDLSSFNTSEVYNMSTMFYNCSSLTELDLSSFDTQKVQSFTAMFAGMHNVITIDISTFDIRTDNMSYMFVDCPKLEGIYIGTDWSCSAWSSSSNMFMGCFNIEGQDGTTYNSSMTDYQCAHAGTGGYMRMKYFSVTIPESGYATFSCDRNLNASFDGLTIFVCNNYSPATGTVSLQDITEHWEPIHVTLNNGNNLDIPVTDKVVPRNTGVMLKGIPGDTYNLPVRAAWTHSLLVENDLVAVTKATHVEPTEGDYTNFMLKNGKFIRIAEADESSKMPANRAYLHVNTELLGLENPDGEAGIRIELPDGTPTDMKAVPAESILLDGAVYDLHGRKVADDRGCLHSLPNGIYIINGQKIMNRK